MFPLANISAIAPAIMPATVTCNVLALATLDDATQIGSFLLAKVRKQGVIMPAISHTILC